MEPGDKKLLEDTYALAKDNNVMLRKIRRRQKWSSFMSVVYWIIIIGISIGAFYYLEPYIDKMMNLYSQVSGSSQTVNSVNLNSLGDMLNNYKIVPK